MAVEATDDVFVGLVGRLTDPRQGVGGVAEDACPEVVDLGLGVFPGVEVVLHEGLVPALDVAGKEGRVVDVLVPRVLVLQVVRLGTSDDDRAVGSVDEVLVVGEVSADPVSVGEVWRRLVAILHLDVRARALHGDDPVLELGRKSSGVRVGGQDDLLGLDTAPVGVHDVGAVLLLLDARDGRVSLHVHALLDAVLQEALDHLVGPQVAGGKRERERRVLADRGDFGVAAELHLDVVQHLGVGVLAQGLHGLQTPGDSALREMHVARSREHKVAVDVQVLDGLLQRSKVVVLEVSDRRCVLLTKPLLEAEVLSVVVGLQVASVSPGGARADESRLEHQHLGRRAACLLVRPVPDGSAGVPAADDEDVCLLRKLWRRSQVLERVLL